MLPKSRGTGAHLGQPYGFPVLKVTWNPKAAEIEETSSASLICSKYSKHEFSGMIFVDSFN